MKFHLVVVPAAVLALAACGDGPTAQSQDAPADVAATEEAPLPSTDLGNTYPSQVGEQSAVTPGATGGRGSAATGQTDAGSTRGAGSETVGGGTQPTTP